MYELSLGQDLTYIVASAETKNNSDRYKNSWHDELNCLKS